MTERLREAWTYLRRVVELTRIVYREGIHAPLPAAIRLIWKFPYLFSETGRPYNIKHLVLRLREKAGRIGIEQ